MFKIIQKKMNSLLIRDTQGRQVSTDGVIIKSYKKLDDIDKDNINSVLMRLIGDIPIIKDLNINFIKYCVRNILPIISEDHPNYDVVVNIYRVFISEIIKNELSETDLLRIVDVNSYVQDLIANDNTLLDNDNALIDIQKKNKSDLLPKAYMLVIGQLSMTKILDEYFI